MFRDCIQFGSHVHTHTHSHTCVRTNTQTITWAPGEFPSWMKTLLEGISGEFNCRLPNQHDLEKWDLDTLQTNMKVTGVQVVVRICVCVCVCVGPLRTSATLVQLQNRTKCSWTILLFLTGQRQLRACSYCTWLKIHSMPVCVCTCVCVCVYPGGENPFYSDISVTSSLTSSVP